MKKVKNQYKIWDKTYNTFISVSHGKSSWATLKGVEDKLKTMCTGNNYSFPKVRKPEEFEIQVYELVCQEVKTYVLNGKKLEEVTTPHQPVPDPEPMTWTAQEIHEFKNGI
jgi:hypothetical protein